MSNVKTYFLFGIAIVGILIAITLYRAEMGKPEPKDGEPQASVNNFEECVAAGFPVLESYPRQCRDDSGNSFVEKIGNELEKNDLIRIASPRPNAVVKSPLIVRGEARGTWFFEASFPVTLLDGNGNVLVETYAQAQASWMTEDFVPFESTIEFETSETATGTLILHKDNPSGLPEHDDELYVPVSFDQSLDTMTITFHVLNTTDINQGDCTATIGITRNVPQTAGIARATLTALLNGLSANERVEGYTTAIPDGVVIKSLNITDGTAFVDFSEALNNVAGSCTVTAIRAQIENTLKEFSTVDNVVISIDGETETILQP